MNTKSLASLSLALLAGIAAAPAAADCRDLRGHAQLKAAHDAAGRSRRAAST
jgi:hypothetical protein